MRKINLLLACVLTMTAWTGVMAQNTSDADYQAALAAITDGGTYRIKTTVSGTDYYVTTGGGLTSVKDNAGYFTITKTSGGYFGTGFRIDTGTDRFTNPPLSNNAANLKPGNYAHSTNDRTDWERQILYLNIDGKYAIRSCNCQDGTSSWADAARTHWTYYINNEVVTPCYTYNKDEAYIWDFEGPLTTVNVTYKLVESDGTTVVSSTTKKQEANSGIITPLPGTGMDFNGFFHEKFFYDYTVSGTIGDTDCTITITRTEKAGLVKALTDLSNTKAYNIGCDRGAMIAYNGSMVNTALNDAGANAQPFGKFALLNYEGNYYIFSIDENKFVKNDASVALDLTAVGFSTEDAMVMTLQTAPYFLWHFNAENKYLNTNGNAPLGYVINNYSTPDPGNLYYMVAVEDFDPTAALAELDAYFHPTHFVTYVVKDTKGNTLFTSDPQPTKPGAKITTLLDEFKRPFTTYNEVDVTISEENTTVEFTATWDGPFELSTSAEDAKWYNMTIRSDYFVVMDDSEPYYPKTKTLPERYESKSQWAFGGNSYTGIAVFNKAKGEGWTLTKDGDKAVMREGTYTWTILKNSDGFVLKETGTDYNCINQSGGTTGPLGFWNSGSAPTDNGSTFRIVDVPTNFASCVIEEIAPSAEATGYFAFIDAVKATIGYDAAYKTDCSYAEYKSMKDNLEAIDMTDLSNFVLPETGYYTLKNKYYSTNNYMGISASDGELWGNYAAANAPKHVVKLTKNADNTYTIGLMGVFAYAPANVAQSTKVIASETPANYTVVITSAGYAAFQADTENNMSALHRRGEGDIVGWEPTSPASQWAVADPEATITYDVQISEAGYATTYLPFSVSIPDGVTVYTGATEETWMKLNKLSNTIPEKTGVVLKGTPATYTFTLGGKTKPEGALDIIDQEVDGGEALVKAFDEPVEGNILKGTFKPIDAVGKYILYQPEGESVGFWQATEGTIPAFKAYLEVASDVKGFIFVEDGATAIKDINNLKDSNDAIYNIAGQRLNKMQKGINIVNGKKVLF